MLVIAAVVAVATAASANERWLSFAAATLVLTSIAHSLLGERFILRPLFQRTRLPKLFGDEMFVPRTVRFAWHLFSILLLGFAALLVATDEETGATVVRIISATAAACSLVAALISRGRHLSWVAFAAVAVATWIAST